MMAQKKDEKQIEPVYDSSFDHLADELRKLDLLIRLQVTEFRLKIQGTSRPAAHQQMYISHEEVDWLISTDGTLEIRSQELTEIRSEIELLQDDINARIKASLEKGVFLALIQLAHIFGLSTFELQVVSICLAPELHRKYDKLYAYLQDDITRKRPSVDLVLDLLCDTQADRWQARSVFSAAAPLFRTEIVHVIDDYQSPSGSSDLAQFLRLDPRILNYLLENNSIDRHLVGIATLERPELTIDRVLVDPEIKIKLLNLTKHHFSAPATDRKKLVLCLHGPYGVGKRDLALGICEQLNCLMLYLDVGLLLAQDANVRSLLRLAFREGLLLQVAMYLDNVDILLREDDQSKSMLKTLFRVIAEYGWLAFMAGEKPWPPRGLFEHTVFHTVELPIPAVPLREAAWSDVLERRIPAAEPAWATQLARQFRLTPGQIQDAVESAAHQPAMEGGGQEITIDNLYAACRNQSNQKLGELAAKIEPHYTWADIILPEAKLAQLNEICNHVRQRYRVFGEWGFDRKLAHGKGLSALFSGPPGTGKTMAAEVIAHELQLDLYKIDLSGVVSKYIGETEKNLSRIFQEAETSNAILFFDEADALFGKRTEISDAHDRYANIEISYLLQKMEEYEGVVILASNLRENMDDAFTRRLRFIVEFPFPDEASRLRIWQTHFPQEAPLSAELDYEYLAKQLKISGGNIKNIVLSSAFSAAENGGVIGMEHILQGARREFEKIGKFWDDKHVQQLKSRRG